MTRVGIDWSGAVGARDNVNRDPESKIRFAWINLDRLGEFAHEMFDAIYTARCPHCGDEIPDDTHFEYRSVKRMGGSLGKESVVDCPSCNKLIREDEQYSDEPDADVCDDGKYKAVLNGGEVVFMMSPYFTHAAFGSPCIPGACHLHSPTDDGERCFCPGPEWFDDESPLPFPIYSVATGERVERAS